MAACVPGMARAYGVKVPMPGVSLSESRSKDRAEDAEGILVVFSTKARTVARREMKRGEWLRREESE